MKYYNNHLVEITAEFDIPEKFFYHVYGGKETYVPAKGRYAIEFDEMLDKIRILEGVSNVNLTYRNDMIKVTIDMDSFDFTTIDNIIQSYENIKT